MEQSRKKPLVEFYDETLSGADGDYQEHKAKVTFFGDNGKVLKVTFELDVETHDYDMFDTGFRLYTTIQERDAAGTREILNKDERIYKGNIKDFLTNHTLSKSGQERKKLYPKELRDEAAKQDVLYRALKKVSFDEDDKVESVAEMARNMVIEKFPKYLNFYLNEQAKEKEKEKEKEVAVEEYIPEEEKEKRKAREEYLKTHPIARVRHKLAKGIDDTFGTKLDEKTPKEVAKGALLKASIAATLAGGVIGAYEYADYSAKKQAKEQIAQRERDEALKAEQDRQEAERLAWVENDIMLKEMEKAGIKLEKKAKDGSVMRLSSVDAVREIIRHDDAKSETKYKFSNPKWEKKTPAEYEKCSDFVPKFTETDAKVVFENWALKIISKYDFKFVKPEKIRQTDWSSLISKAEQQR